MNVLKRNNQLEDEYSLLSEMDILQVFGGVGTTRDVGHDCSGAGDHCTDVGNGCQNAGKNCTGSGSGSGSGSGDGNNSGLGNGFEINNICF